ncbi:MAG TPA: 50S ribosomal protein L20 [Myxococcales bacterium]|nr:50S ribosomal protein L20 [Deltaproteobacteria bacterium]HAA54395.1 50S ribosomal protein L20 [Myxococcales bacterium]|tara:strand:- start:458 stop:814 length:357 start_codon:yes stop_codon:yes gene_type:complete
MRVKGGFKTRRRRNRQLKRVSGFVAGRRRIYRQAMETLRRALAYSYRDRRQKKRDFRRLWIARINAAAKANGISYSRMIHGLKQADCTINRKVLADIAVRDPATFTALTNLAKENLSK